MLMFPLLFLPPRDFPRVFPCGFVLTHTLRCLEWMGVDSVCAPSAILFRDPGLFPDLQALVLAARCVQSVPGYLGSPSTTDLFAPSSSAHIPAPGDTGPFPSLQNWPTYTAAFALLQRLNKGTRSYCELVT